MPPNMTQLQFIVCGSTGRAVGKKQKKKNGMRKTSAVTLIARPHFPRENLLGGMGSPRSRLEMTQPIETM